MTLSGVERVKLKWKSAILGRSCWAFSTTAALESKVLITYDMPWVDLDLSEQIVLSCSGAGNCEKGGPANKTADFLVSTGTYREGCYPYTATDGDCKQACSNWQTYAYKIDGWSWVVAGNVTDIDVIKNALYTSGPLGAWLKLYKDFLSYGGGVYSNTTGDYIGSNHYVLIVGWDDSLHALKCKNSWGTNWGESGFFWIDYKELYGTGTTEFTRSRRGAEVHNPLRVIERNIVSQCDVATPSVGIEGIAAAPGPFP